MSNKQCEEKLKDRGVRPTAARILVLNMLAKQWNWRFCWKHWTNRPFPGHWHYCWNTMPSMPSKTEAARRNMKSAEASRTRASLQTGIFISFVKCATKRNA